MMTARGRPWAVGNISTLHQTDGSDKTLGRTLYGFAKRFYGSLVTTGLKG
jgi:hypothetical protein